MEEDFKYYVKIVAGIIFLKFIMKFKEYLWLSHQLANLYIEVVGIGPIAAAIRVIKKQDGIRLGKL